MTATLTALVYQLADTAEDRWRPGHPTTQAKETLEDRLHDRTRPNDTTADTVSDPARIALASAWRRAMDHVNRLAAIPAANGFRVQAIAASEDSTSTHLARLNAAHTYWTGDTGQE